jgi:uncharacterized membrane-anchored protein
MISNKKGLLIALIAPIIILAILTGYKKYILSIGKEVTLAISGYDPRDLLSGHYLIYTVEYGVENVCKASSYGLKKAGYICLSPKSFSYDWPSNCDLVIKGSCYLGRFNAGIERYYVPEEEAQRLEVLVRTKKASIVLSVPRNGKAQIKDLLIDGTPWRAL